MRRILGLALGLFTAVACGGGGSGAGNPNNICGQAIPKFESCGFHTLANNVQCQEPDDADELCFDQCLLKLPCSAFVAAYCHNDINQFSSCISQCEPPPFVCADGEQVSGDSKCDGYEECLDGSDEAGCPTLDCGDGGTYVDNDKCDGYAACSNGADEIGCPGAITCSDGTTVGESSHCDGYDDCPDAEDEAGCVLVTCGDGTTYPADYKCDGYADCSDGSDEVGCSTGSGGGGGMDADEAAAIDCQSL